jgi:hypothetical protein
MFTALRDFAQPLLHFLADDPALLMLQGAMVAASFLAIYLIFLVTRDVLLRTHSLPFMVFSILLVALVPFVGFLLYLLIRPPSTLLERDRDRMLQEILAKVAAEKRQQGTAKKGGIVPAAALPL